MSRSNKNSEIRISCPLPSAISGASMKPIFLKNDVQPACAKRLPKGDEMSLKEKISELSKSLNSLLSLPKKDFPKSLRLSKKPGVYIIYEGEKPIYVGRAKNLSQRIKDNLLQGNVIAHTLRRKLTAEMAKEKGTSPGEVNENEITSFIQANLRFQSVEVDLDNAKRYLYSPSLLSSCLKARWSLPAVHRRGWEWTACNILSDTG